MGKDTAVPSSHLSSEYDCIWRQDLNRQLNKTKVIGEAMIQSDKRGLRQTHTEH